VDERGGAPLTITLETLPGSDTIRIHFLP